ncbi:MAG: gfo/Idh/MocA family oxidoreductase, partial [Isosphaeraceae bacterium]
VDVARWGLGVDAPTTVSSGGGLYVFDGLEVPDTQVVTWNFPEKKTSIVWEHRMWSTHGLDGSGFGIAFYGDKGTVIIDSKSWRVEDGPKGGGSAKVEQQAAHIANFLDCVKTRKAPHAEIEIGHASTRLCHLGNIAHRLGKTLTFDAKTESFPNEPEANNLLSREYSSRFEMPSQV